MLCPSTWAPTFSTQMPWLFIIKICFTIKAWKKLIQSVVRVEILRICVTSLILRVLRSGFWVPESQVPSLRDPVSRSWVSGSQFQGPGCRGPVSLGPRAPESQVSGLRVLDLRFPGSLASGSRVSGPDFRLCLFIWMSDILKILKNIAGVVSL